MHIIKITPVSFKIILTREDLQRYGVENILEDERYSGEFFAEIIDRTNSLYGCPFREGSVDAEFFASKDGGGELFLSSTRNNKTPHTYLFRTNSLDNLIVLCNYLAGTHLPQHSTLYFDDNIYCLLMEYEKRDDFLISRIREFGDLKTAGKLEIWLIEEHGKIIMQNHAIEQILFHFGILK